MTRQEPFSSVCITGVGMVSSLGYDSRNSCAAARAGLSGLGELTDFSIKSEIDGEELCISGHQVLNITTGFEGFTRLSVLGRMALQNLNHNHSLSDLVTDRTGFFLSLPRHDRLMHGIELISNPDVREGRANLSNAVQVDDGNKSYGVRLSKILMAQLGLQIPVSNCFQFYNGHCSIGTAMLAATHQMNLGRFDHAIVGGIDCYLDEHTIQWLLDTGRLKTDSMAFGLQPGEAGSFILIEKHEAAQYSGSEILGSIVAISITNEELTLQSGKTCHGAGLSEAIFNAVSSIGKDKCLPFWIISDQNGETYRANEWGHALIRLIPSFPELAENTLWLPSLSFGETGTASGFISICLAAQGFERGYGASNYAIIVSSDEDKLRSAVIISKK